MTLCATPPNIHKTFVISVVAFEIFTIKDQILKVDLEQEVQGRKGKYYMGIVSTMQEFEPNRSENGRDKTCHGH